MADQEIQTQQVEISSGDLAIAAYLAQPSATGTFPGVVVLQEIFGVNSHIRDVTERIAKQGYVAIAPALYQRQAPGFETGYTPEDIQVGREYKDKTKASELLGDIQAAINYLKSLPNVVGDRIGCIGFCFGGHVAYLAATLPDIKATASFYGAGIATMTPGGSLPTVSRTGEIQGSLYAFFGEQDTSIPPEQVQKIEAALKLHQIPHQVFRYPEAEHGFFCDQRASYNSEAAQDAWPKVLQLFETTLKAAS
ncbi:MAG: dienelactone hydrolase family protein [Trichocoleus desertorum ATA4-8-CV12]|jgi:carboxymethylenebutenolidase|nr:dienelactone hydrolase family protein [Trichocoleus desertorum ATA4-8-CV12]